jgi:hypothetical protein
VRRRDEQADADADPDFNVASPPPPCKRFATASGDPAGFPEKK